MDLLIYDRLVLLSILPKDGNLVTMRVVRTLNERLGFTEEEIAKHNIKEHENGNVTWDEGEPKPIEIGAKAREIIVNALNELDTQKKVEPKHLPLFDKFDIGVN